jgi:two-component system, chemotaxis family, chemotaxis protein CheY
VKTLIVDDEVTSRELLSMILKAYGTVDTAADGLEGLKAYNLALGREPYDLIMLDIMLPRMDGQQVLKAIRRIEQERGLVGPEQVKIVMITALGDFSNVSQAFASACTSYLTKPILADKVKAELAKLGFHV